MLSVSLPVLGWCINTAWTLPLYIKGLFWLKRKKCYPQMIIVDWKHNSKYSIFTREILLNPINCSRVLKSAGLKGLTVQRWMISNLTKRGWFGISPPSEGQTRCSSAWREEGWHLGLMLGRLHRLRRRWWWQLWWWWRKMKWGFSRGDQLLMWKTILQRWNLSILWLSCLMYVDIFAHLCEKSLPGVPVLPSWLCKYVSQRLTGAR